MTKKRAILISLSAVCVGALAGSAHALIAGGVTCTPKTTWDGSMGFTCQSNMEGPPSDGEHLDQPPPGFDLPVYYGSPPVLYRVYNWRTGDHLYSIDYNETYDALWSYGYGTYEGYIGRCWGSYQPGTMALFRLVNGSHHFYTNNWNEMNDVQGIGYTYEGVACYVYPAGTSGTCPIYRILIGENHFYTTSSSERDMVLQNGGIDEGNVGAIANPYGCD